MKTPAVRLLGSLLLLSFVALPLRAQTTGLIRGVVDTGQTPLPGVAIEAKSPNLQGSRTAVTDAEGRFTLPSLPPGTYTITATLQGFAPRKETVVLALNQPASIRIELLAAQAAEVTVTAEAAQVQTESTTIGRNLDAKVFQALPTGRNYSSVAQLASGVNTDESDPRNASITVYGSTGLENQYLVDGANTTGAEIGNQGKVLNFEFIQEVEFKSGGYEAEYGGAQGGILNVVTKSGGNEFHGDAFGYINRDALQANNKHIDELTSSGIPIGFSKSDYGADIGGYVLKDKLWFFGAYDHVVNTQNTQITQGPPDVIGTETSLDTTSNLFAGKLTWRFNESNTLIGTVFGDPTDDVGAVGPVIGPPTTYDGTVTVGGTDFGFRYEGILGPKFLLTGQFAYHRENVSTLPGPGGDQIAYLDNTGDFSTASGGFQGTDGTGQFDDKKFTRYDYRINGNYFVGDHDVKAGFEFERNDANVFRDYSGRQFVTILSPYEDDPLQRLVYFHSFFASPDATIDNAATAPVIATPQNDNFSVFVQDRWSILSNLTLNAGVRWEKQIIRGLDDITYINVNHFSPRVGVTWDPWNDGRTKVAASYSQFVPIIPLDMNIRSLNGERDGATYNFDPVDLNCNPDAERSTDELDNTCVIRGLAVDAVDPNIRSPYADEVVAGVERQIGANWSVGVRGIYRSLRRIIEDSCVPSDTCDNYAFTNPGFSQEVCLNGADCQPAPQFAPAARFFRGIEVTAQKRLSNNWMLYASYLYGTLKGNFDGAFRAIGGFFAKNPNITDDFDYPEFQVNAYGDLTLDRRHQAKLQAGYIFPFGLTLSASAYYQTGTPLSRIGWWNNYAGPELFVNTRGTDGRTPDTYEVDMHLDYALTIRPVTIHILADLFNTLNRQQISTVDQTWALDQADNNNPTPTNDHYGLANTWQQPRTLRLGLRVSF
jgi:Carboxypeptidase regulatory-like domain/TonB dependent receptor-like, beta-barrel/TonB-dependent Receptor Plug Domain